MRPKIRYARKRLDLAFGDIARAFGCCLRPLPPERAAGAIATTWRPTSTVLPCLSVRSGFDLYLAAVDWPPGSEVLLSAITIPHLAKLVRLHGYVPIGLDVDPETMAVEPADVADACGPRTRAVVFAQLFGSRTDLTPLAAVCAERGIALIDDRAQCYDGVGQDLGPADVAMYSFGTIKTATCLGGAVLLIADPEVRAAMVDLQRRYPVQSRWAYAAKVAKAAGLLLATSPAAYGAFTTTLERLTGDYDQVIRQVSRGFDDRSLIAGIRRQPSAALLSVMARRLGGYDPRRLRRRRLAGEQLAAWLHPQVEHLGAHATGHTHWLFPVISREPDALVTAGRAAGFDLTRGSSTLVTVDPSCAEASRLMRDVVYLPAYHPMPIADLARLAAVVNAVELRYP